VITSHYSAVVYLYNWCRDRVLCRADSKRGSGDVAYWWLPFPGRSYVVRV